MNHETAQQPVTLFEPPTALPEPNGTWSSPAVDKICAALAHAQVEMPGIPKDSDNPYRKSRYASLGAVISHSRPILGKHGLAIIQTPTMEGNTVRVHTRVVHESGQWIDGGMLECAIADDSNVLQSAGGIITYMRRYSRMAVLQLYGDEDDDGNTTTTTTKPQSAARPAAPAAPPAATATTKQLTEVEQKAKWDRIRLKLLNKLQCFEGQLNRPFITRFLIHKGWITRTQIPEDWPSDKIPMTDETWQALLSEIQAFEEIDKKQEDIPY